MNVLKFGGTSVGSAQRIQEVAKLISDDQPKIVVLSAMSGTTNTLVDITNYLYRNDRQEALTTIQNLELDYLMTISDLYSTEEFKHRGQEFVQTIFTYLRSFINKDFYPLQEKAVVAQGEIISTTLMHYYLQEQGIPSTLLSALDFMRIDKDCLYRAKLKTTIIQPSHGTYYHHPRIHLPKRLRGNRQPEKRG